MKQIRSQIEILDDRDLDQLHEATLKVLSTVGCRLPHRRVLDMMRAAGAEVDEDTAIVHLPPGLVERAVQETSSRKIAEWAGSGEVTIVQRERFHLGMSTQANMVDYGARSRRQGSTEDVIKGIVLCNELPHITRCMPIVTPADVPAHIGDLYGYTLCTLYSEKAYGVYILSPETARLIVRIHDLVGSAAGRPQVSYLLEPSGSLAYDEYSLEMALIFAGAGHRIHAGPMAMAGLDAPVTLAGTLVIQNADSLIAVVLCHLLGLPGSWSGSAHTMDMRSALCSFGSPNQALLGLAAVQLGRYYGYDVQVNSALTDACLPDFQAGFEKGMSAIVALLSGAGGIGAQGIVGADQGASLEQLVIDDEWASAVAHILDLGVEVNKETLALDTIRSVGIGGTYVAEEHTVRHMRETYWPSRLFNQKSWDAWMKEGGRDVYARAHERVLQILDQHYPPQPLLSDPIIAELNALVADAQSHPERFEAQRYSSEKVR